MNGLELIKLEVEMLMLERYLSDEERLHHPNELKLDLLKDMIDKVDYEIFQLSNY